MSWFKPEEEAKDVGFQAMEPGVYKLFVREAGMQAPKNGGPDFVKIDFEAIDDAVKNRRIFENFNIQHANEHARNMGRALFGQLCKAAKTGELSGPDDVSPKLKDKIVLGQVVKRKDDYSGGFKNSVNKFWDVADEKGVEKWNATKAKLAANPSGGSTEKGSYVPPPGDQDIPY